MAHTHTWKGIKCEDCGFTPPCDLHTDKLATHWIGDPSSGKPFEPRCNAHGWIA
jgi:hypothetical protein